MRRPGVRKRVGANFRLRETTRRSEKMRREFRWRRQILSKVASPAPKDRRGRHARGAEPPGVGRCSHPHDETDETVSCRTPDVSGGLSDS